MELRELPLSVIDTDKDQPRKEFDISELKESIRQNGVLVPIIVQPNTLGGDAEFIILDGERRFRSSRELGLETVPAVINTSRRKNRFQDQIIIDHQRHNLTVEEKSAAWTSLLDQFDNDYEEVAKAVGVSISQVKNVIEGAQFKARVKDQLPDDLGWRERAVIRRTNRIKDDNMRAKLIIAAIENNDSNKLIDAKVRILANKALDEKRISPAEQKIIVNAKDIEEAIISIRNMRDEAARETHTNQETAAPGPVKNINHGQEEARDVYNCPYCSGVMEIELSLATKFYENKKDNIRTYLCRQCTSIFVLKANPT